MRVDKPIEATMGSENLELSKNQLSSESSEKTPSIQLTTDYLLDKSMQALYHSVSLLFKASEDNIVVTDSQARVMYMNPALLKKLNLTLPHVQGFTGLELFPNTSAVRQSFYATQEVINTGKAQSILLHGPQHSLAQPLYDVLNITPLLDELGNVLGTLTVGRAHLQEKNVEAEEIKRREHYQRALLDSFPFMVWLKDKESRFLATNRAFVEVTGLAGSQALEGKTDFDFFPEELAKNYIADDLSVLQSGRSAHLVEFIQRGDGESYWAETYKSPVSIDGIVIGTVGFSKDLSEHQQLLSEISKKELEYAALIKHLPLSIIRYNLDCKRILVNSVYSEHQECRKGFLGKAPSDIWCIDIKNMTAVDYQERLQEVMQTGVTQTFEVLSNKNEQISHVHMVNIFAEFDLNKQVLGALALWSDISEISQYREQLEHLAFHDALTDLPNRALLNDRMQVAVSHAERHHNLFGLLILDLDGFKNINDSAGHAVGDQLLIKAGKRILSCMRSSDLVARIGGDEFAVLLTDIHQHHDLAGLAHKISTYLATPYSIDGATFFVTVSIGIACFPKDSDNIADLMKYADTAMYHAKKKGRNNYQFYSSDLTFSVTARLMIETELRYALEKHEFSLEYQPFVDMRDGKIIGAEVLLRWFNSALGDVPPEKFIPIAEDCGLIVNIGDWVLLRACESAVVLNSGRDKPLMLAVNLSSKQLVSHDIFATLSRYLALTGCQPNWLTLEITEGLLLQDSDDVLQKLNDLSSIGVSIAIDDFGTGYSALAYLNKFPVSQVKIDRSFVHDISINYDAALLVKAIIAMAKSLNKELLAEGIETEEQKVLLNSFGCYHAQGFFFSPAVTFAEFCLLVDGRRILPMK